MRMSSFLPELWPMAMGYAADRQRKLLIANKLPRRKLISQKALLAQHTAQSEAPFFSQALRPIHETTSHLHGADWQKGSPKEQFEQTKGPRGIGTSNS